MLISSAVYSQDLSSNHLLILKTYNINSEAEKSIDYSSNMMNSDKDIEIRMEVANAYYKLNDIKNATNVYIEINKQNNKKANLELAKCYASLKKATFAVSYLNNYLKGSNRINISELKSINEFKNIDTSQEWIELWNTNWYNSNDLLFNDALYEYRIGNVEQSSKICTKLLQKRPSYHQVYDLLCRMAIDDNDMDLALIEIEQAISIKPENANYLFIKSNCLLSLGKGKKALGAINQAIEIDSSQVDYYINRVKAFLLIEKYDLAQEQMESILKINSSMSMCKVAADTYFKNEDYLSALKYYNKCIGQSKLSPDLYIERANVYATIGTYEFAEKDYSMALDFYPMNGELYFKRALVRIEQKNYLGACSDIKKARGFNYMAAEEYLKKYCY